MALLQINEPQDSQTQGIAAAIDLGTTHSLIAWSEQGKIETLTIDGSPIVPSVIYFTDDDQVLIGQPAIAASQKAQAPDQLIRSAKRLLGKSLAEANQAFFGQSLADNNEALIVLQNKTISPVEVCAHIIQYLTQSIEHKLNRNISNASNYTACIF